jgi:hypothetical protein
VHFTFIDGEGKIAQNGGGVVLAFIAVEANKGSHAQGIDSKKLAHVVSLEGRVRFITT